MPLINCPECQNSVSDSAVICPKCGYPIKVYRQNPQKPLNLDSPQVPQRKNKGCVNFILILFVILICWFLWKQCSKAVSESRDTAATTESFDISQDSLNKKVTITVNGKTIETTVRNRVVDSLYLIKEEKFKNSKAGKIQKKHPEWSQEDCERVANNQIWIGMHYDMLVYQRGKPNHVNTSNYGNGPQYQACWGDYEPGCFYFDESRIITSYN